MTDIIKDCSNTELIIEAIEKLWFEHFAFWGSAPSREVYEDQYLKRVTLFAPERAQFNCVHLARLTPENVHLKIDETVEYFKSRKLPLQWSIGPSTRPIDLGEHLQAKGFTKVSGDTPGMAVELDSMNDDFPEQSGFTIKPVEDVETLKDWIQAATEGFGLKQSSSELLFEIESEIGFSEHLPRRSYVGYLDGKPVSNSMLLMASGVAGLFAVSTISEERRRGIGTLISLFPLKEARERGYRVGVVHSSDMGYGVYRRLGFEDYCKIELYRLYNDV
jgi:GNAT superfamily N-acetyltransferase